MLFGNADGTVEASSYLPVMSKPKHTARIENIYFLSRIGTTLRWATQDIAREDLPADIKRLLGRLDRLEARAAAQGTSGDDDPDT